MYQVCHMWEQTSDVCRRMPTYADVYWRLLTQVMYEVMYVRAGDCNDLFPTHSRMLTYTDVCMRVHLPVSNSLTWADVRWHTLTYADVRWRTLTYAGECNYLFPTHWRMLTYADVRWRMLTYADVCRTTLVLVQRDLDQYVARRMLTYADVCWRMPTYAGQLWVLVQCDLDQHVARRFCACWGLHSALIES